MEKLLLPVVLSFMAANISVLLYFNEFVLDLETSWSPLSDPCRRHDSRQFAEGQYCWYGRILRGYTQKRKQIPLQPFSRGEQVRSPYTLYSKMPSLRSQAYPCQHCNCRACLSSRDDDRADPRRCKPDACNQVSDLNNDCSLRFHIHEHCIQYFQHDSYHF